MGVNKSAASGRGAGRVSAGARKDSTCGDTETSLELIRVSRDILTVNMSSTHRFKVGVDFGTTFSGVAYASCLQPPICSSTLLGHEYRHVYIIALTHTT